jgi:Tol biopolymer transport system component
MFESPSPPGNAAEAAPGRLESWKEIAAYLKRDVSTVQRWEKREGLPVHRLAHVKQATVYAFPGELDAWWRQRRPEGAHARRAYAWLAVPGLIVAGVAVWWWIPGPPHAADLVERRIWAGPDVGSEGGVSPDGRLLAFRDAQTGDLAVRDLAAGKDRRLTNKPARARSGEVRSVVFSPDGTMLAYVWNQSFADDIRLIGADGTGERVLYADPDFITPRVHAWTPDGKQLLATARRRRGTAEVVLLNVGDGSLRLVKTLGSARPRGMGISPDGLHAAYDLAAQDKASGLDIFLLSLPAGHDTVLVRHPSNDFLLGWAPDSSTVLFGSDRSGTTDAWAVAVSQGKAAGAPVRARKDMGRIWPIGFAENGAYYYTLRTGMMDVYVARMNAGAGRIEQGQTVSGARSMGSNISPDWSPDGRFLAYISEAWPQGQWEQPRVVIREWASGAERELPTELKQAETLCWASDGKSLLVTGTDDRDRHGLFRVDAGTAGTVAVARSSELRDYYHSPRQSPLGPRGRLIYYKLRDLGMEPSRLLLKDTAAGREKVVVESGYRYDLSRDGKWLAYSSFDEATEYIAVIASHGGTPREVFREPRSGRIYSVAWTPDGQHLLFAKRGQLWRVAVQRGEPRLLGLTAEGLRELRVHPDGTRLAYTAGSPKGELWVMENFLPARILGYP